MLTWERSLAVISEGERKLRLRLELFLVRICLAWEWRLRNNPEAVLLKRFAAPRFVFIFGMIISLVSCFYRRHYEHDLPPFLLGMLLDNTIIA